MKTLFMMFAEYSGIDQASLGGIWKRDRCARTSTATDGTSANTRKFTGNDRMAMGLTKSSHGDVGLSLWKIPMGNGQP